MFATLTPKPFVIAEIGVNHNGDADVAGQLIRAAKQAGADAVKFQTYRTESCITRSAPLADYQARGDAGRASQYDMLKGLELSSRAHHRLKALADRLGIMFLSTPDDDWSLNLLAELEVEAIKIASAEIPNPRFLAQIAKMGRPVILSTGMSTLEEVRAAVAVLVDGGAPDIAVLHCTSNYPCAADQANMAAITTLRQNFPYCIGFSDHTRGVEAGIMAVALGCHILEKHITLDRDQRGPDHLASQTPAEFSDYVIAVRTAARMLGSGEKVPQVSEMHMRTVMRRKIVAARPLRAGSILVEQDLAFKRADQGVEPSQSGFFVGRRLARRVAKDSPILQKDLEHD